MLYVGGTTTKREYMKQKWNELRRVFHYHSIVAKTEQTTIKTYVPTNVHQNTIESTIQRKGGK